MSKQQLTRNRHYGSIKPSISKVILSKVIQAAQEMLLQQEKQFVEKELRANRFTRKVSGLPKFNSRGNWTFYSWRRFSGGSAKQGRNREYQAVLPLRGKILNTYVDVNGAKKLESEIRTKTLSKMISSNEIMTLINALGLDPKDEEIDLKNLRYGKIIIMTDADVDGSHIRALLLTFFNNKPFNKLIEKGHIYLAQPPLFKINKGGKVSYIKDEKELENFIEKNSKDLKN